MTSTFREWHYFVGGGAVGFLVGVVVAFYVLLVLERAERRRATGRRGRYPRGPPGEEGGP